MTRDAAFQESVSLPFRLREEICQGQDVHSCRHVGVGCECVPVGKVHARGQGNQPLLEMGSSGQFLHVVDQRELELGL